MRDRNGGERLALVGKMLRRGVETPTDTYITDGLPLLLTRLSQVPPIPPVTSRGR